MVRRCRRAVCDGELIRQGTQPCRSQGCSLPLFLGFCSAKGPHAIHRPTRRSRFQRRILYQPRCVTRGRDDLQPHQCHDDHHRPHGKWTIHCAVKARAASCSMRWSPGPVRRTPRCCHCAPSLRPSSPRMRRCGMCCPDTARAERITTLCPTYACSEGDPNCTDSSPNSYPLSCPQPLP